MKTFFLPTIVTAAMFAILTWWSIGSYYSADDPYFLHFAHTAPAALTAVFMPVGRWLNLYLIQASFGAVPHLSDLWAIRIVTSAFLVLQFILTRILVVRIGTKDPWATGVSALSLAVPSTMPILAWAQHWTVAAAACLVTSSVLICLLVAQTWTSPVRRTLAWTISFYLVYSAGSINQSMLGFVPVWGFVILLGSADSRILLRTLVPTGLIFAGATAACYATAKFLQGQAGGRGTLTSDPYGKIAWFFDEPLTNAFNLFMLRGEPPRTTTAIVVACATILLLMMLPNKTIERRATIAASFAATLPLAYVANLVVAENWASYRSIWPLTTLCTITMSLSVALHLADRMAPLRAVGIVATATVLSGIFWSHNYGAYMWTPYVTDAEKLRTSLIGMQEQRDLNEVNVVHLATPAWPPKHGSSYYDDVGSPVVREWTPVPAVKALAVDPASGLSAEWTRIRIAPMAHGSTRETLPDAHAMLDPGWETIQEE